MRTLDEGSLQPKQAYPSTFSAVFLQRLNLR
jgi:hypothetical protein